MLPWKNNKRKIYRILEEKNLTALLLLNPSNITYITGMRDPSGAFILSEKCGESLLVPLLDYYRATKNVEIDVYAFYRGSEGGIRAEIPRKKIIEGGLIDAVNKILGECKGKIGGDLSTITYSTAKLLLDKLQIEDVTREISRMRAVKSEEEIKLIEEAVKIAETAFSQAIQRLEEGVSEAEIASIIDTNMRMKGAWSPAFPTITGFYSNTAFPHHTPGLDKLSVPGPVLIDWGAIYSGYRSDTTRSLWWGGKATKQYIKHLELVIEASMEALDLLAPGVTAGEVDQAARRSLEKEGLAKFFIHGLGHGVGIDIHEEPFLRPASKTLLEAGMIVTIEPGIYLPGLYGIRVENTVLITKTGYKVLNTLPSLIPT